MTCEIMVARRVAGEPLEQIVGWAEFCGLRVAVAPGVFVPRRRTEALVDLAVAIIVDLEQPVVVDLCCGTGAIGVADRRARTRPRSCTPPTSIPRRSPARGAT